MSFQMRRDTFIFFKKILPKVYHAVEDMYNTNLLLNSKYVIPHLHKIYYLVMVTSMVAPMIVSRPIFKIIMYIFSFWINMYNNNNLD